MIDILIGGAVQAHAFALDAVSPFLPVVLSDHEHHIASRQLDALQLSIVFPALPHGEAEDVAIPGKTLLDVPDGEPTAEVRRRLPSLPLFAFAGFAAFRFAAGFPGALATLFALLDFFVATFLDLLVLFAAMSVLLRLFRPNYFSNHRVRSTRAVGLNPVAEGVRGERS
ncbi:MAG: hypothetical protein M3P29_05595 [Acidobacteriota bacterium]|nr:hypothetical protein [Acidobacteriota bacterium]